jgi:D-lactate dehydrogenase
MWVGGREHGSHAGVPTLQHALPNLRLSKMKRGAMLINVSRGGLLDTDAVIEALRTGQIGALGIDVYEGERAWAIIT